MGQVVIVSLLLVAAVVGGCGTSRNDGFDWGNRQVLDCVAGKC